MNKINLFYIDLDGMKWINDSLGHKEGDNALIEVAAVLNETFRSSDIIARMDGASFAVVLSMWRYPMSFFPDAGSCPSIHARWSERNERYS
jgi:diguanylate cyclase (GGDEF)-like protein